MFSENNKISGLPVMPVWWLIRTLKETTTDGMVTPSRQRIQMKTLGSALKK
jgi:hypothetical protein